MLILMSKAPKYSPRYNTHIRGKSIFNTNKKITASPVYNTYIRGKSIFVVPGKRGRPINPNSQRQKAIRRHLNAIAQGLSRAKPIRKYGPRLPRRGSRWNKIRRGL